MPDAEVTPCCSWSVSGRFSAPCSSGRRPSPSRTSRSAENLGKEGRPQIATALEEGFGRGLDPGEQGFPLVARVGQGLAQRLGGAQNDRRPELLTITKKRGIHER